MKQFFAPRQVHFVTPPTATQDSPTVTTIPTSVRIPWQRMIVSLCGIGVILFQWRWAVNHLYTLQPPALPAFTSITVNSQYVVGALAIFFVTGKLIYDWRNATVSQVIQEAQTTTQSVIKPKYFDDETIP